jgi:hypothetical protein
MTLAMTIATVMAITILERCQTATLLRSQNGYIHQVGEKAHQRRAYRLKASDVVIYRKN